MATQRPTAAGGFPVAAGAVGGAVIGWFLGQATAWFFAGLIAGIVVALLIWWRGR